LVLEKGTKKKKKEKKKRETWGGGRHCGRRRTKNSGTEGTPVSWGNKGQKKLIRGGGNTELLGG